MSELQALLLVMEDARPESLSPLRMQAVGVALTYLRVGDSWECYEIPDVMVLEKCALTLYSTRVMHALFGFKHAFGTRKNEVAH